VLIIGYFVVLLLVAAAGVPTLLATVRALDRQQQSSDPTAAATNNVLVGALNEETGVRGFVITRNTLFLGPYTRGSQQVTDAFAILHGQHVDGRLSRNIDTAEAAFRRWHNTFTEPALADVRAGNVVVARKRIQSGKAKKLFDEFRIAHDRLRVSVDQVVTASRRRLRHDVERSLIALLAALAAGFAVATGVWLWWRVWGKRDAERERELADLAVLLRSVLEATPVPIFAKDADGKHILANRARAASLTRGDANAEVIGRSVDDFLDRDMAAQIRAEDLSVLETGRESRSEEVLAQPDGAHIFLTTKSPLEDSEGRRIGVVGVARDVTEERRLQADRDRLYHIEHRLAASLQQAMLGNAELDDDRLDVCARYRPALEELTVGGDWYDVVALPNDMIGLIVGDAVGRGIDAATAMGQLRSALTALALAGLEPAGALEAVEGFARTIPDAHSATCLYAVIDPANRRLVYSVAGHMPPLVVSADGTTTYLDGFQDPPLAATRLDRPRRVGVQPFPVDSTLVLFTDGLIERRTESLDVGLERLARAAAATVQRTTPEICDNLLEVLLADQLQRDDVAIVVARLMKTRSDRFRKRIKAGATDARLARHDFQDWISNYELGDEAQSDLALAIGEALANAVEHAYFDSEAGVIEVDGVYSDGSLRITVRDHGLWRAPHNDPVRGRGLMLMRRLVDDVRVDTDQSGTSVVLEYRVRARNATA
jgi:PAS domain S-box-containing protein